MTNLRCFNPLCNGQLVEDDTAQRVEAAYVQGREVSMVQIAAERDALQALADAAEARVAELERRDRQRVTMIQNACRIRDRAIKERDDLRAGITALANEWERMASVDVIGERFNPDKSAGIAAGLDAAVRDAHALLCSTDTEVKP